MSTLFLRTLRDDPADAEVPSHRLLVRAGYIRRAAPGGFTWLPLGWIVYRNVERVVREEMDRGRLPGGALPGAAPARAVRGDRSLDRVRRQPVPPPGPQGRRLSCSAPTHEEMFTLLVKDLYCVVQGPAAGRSTRSRPSTATRPAPAPACCAAASS